MAIQLIIRSHALEMMSAIALVYAVDNWDEFAKEMGFVNGPDGEKGMAEMRDEICHFTAQMLYENDNVLRILFSVWGEEKVQSFVDKMMDHKHEDGEENGESMREKALSR